MKGVSVRVRLKCSQFPPVHLSIIPATVIRWPSLAGLGSGLGRPAAQNLQEAVDLVGVTAEAGQQEVEVDQLGGVVLAQVWAPVVGQVGQVLGGGAHLLHGAGRVDQVRSVCFTVYCCVAFCCVVLRCI